MKYVLPKHIKIRTEPLNKFIENHSRGVEYFLFVLHAVDSADSMRRIARNALVNTGAREPSENFNEDHYSKELRKFRKYNQMLLVNNTIQYFGVYFSEISSAIYHEKLDMLRSSEVMRHSDIMSLPSKEDIVEYIIDQKVSNISHMGLDKIIEHSNKTFGINLFENQENYKLAKLMHEIRNINVHNDGIVNSIFLDRIKFEIGINYSKGKFLNVGWDDYTKMTNIVVKEVLNFDRQARKKFGLPTIRIS